MTADKFLGIVVTPANVQSEGLEQVFNNLEYAGASAIALDPWLLVPAESGAGSRMPDLHIDGYARLLTRPLWGRRELFVSSFLSFEPTEDLYGGSVYRPQWQPLPAGLDPDLPHRMIAEARRRGLRVFMELAPFLPPHPRPEDRPVRVDGEAIRPPWIAEHTCLNSLEGRRYALTFIQDLVSHFPGLDGLILDWVEFGAYRLEDHFTCFCPHCESRAVEHGLDWDAIRRDVSALWHWLHELTAHRLARSRRVVANPAEILDLLVRYPGWLAFLKFKAACVFDFYRSVRARLDQLGEGGLSLTARGWCSPWNRSSGMDYHALADVCGAVAPKLFTFDHAAIPRWFGQALLDWNPGLSERGALDAVIDWLNLADDVQERSFAHYRIPAPGAPHPARMAVYRQRVEEHVDQVQGQAACYPIAHPYLPEGQWERMVAMLRDSQADGMWVNFYSFLSDAHLRILRQTWPA